MHPSRRKMKGSIVGFRSVLLLVLLLVNGLFLLESGGVTAFAFSTIGPRHRHRRRGAAARPPLVPARVVYGANASRHAMLPDHAISLVLSSSDMMTMRMAEDSGAIPQQLSKATTVAVFIAGVIPFAIATYEFWRRIAVGDSFGTTTDSVVFFIGQDDAPAQSRGRQVLGRDSMITAYIIFTVAAAVLALVIFAVVTSPDPPADMAMVSPLPIGVLEN
jgi:hypothetical protein